MGAGGLQFARDYAIIFNVSLSPCATVHRQCKNRAGVKNLEKHVSAVLVAAGSSTRMGFDKLSFDLGGETVLERSVRAFDECPEVDELVIVTGASGENLCSSVPSTIPMLYSVSTSCLLYTSPSPRDCS